MSEETNRLPHRPDCQSCIMDFGQRHKMNFHAHPDGPPFTFCTHHDRPMRRMTIQSMDHAGVMRGLAYD